MALAVVLLAGASLLVRSHQRLRAVDPGFDPRGVLVAPIFLDMEQYGSGEKTRAYYGRLLERLEALPGVVSAGGATALPTSPLGPDFERPVWPEEAPGEERSRRPGLGPHGHPAVLRDPGHSRARRTRLPGLGRTDGAAER